ncbi:hypothetical protein AB835_06130 [Candidatus Endobugula sertula]|uniref:Thiol:disulfide interchange protein n=1 Tax=Candidatus Endobugula sertula TaxID=62101 RepID=A0A1D2QQX3_9GAMM|nr:hypothetical protein AB835_06130 [Candidatus Endobugula sertula]
MEKRKPDAVVPEEIQTSIFARLKQARPDLEPSNLRYSPMEGLYKMKLDGRVVFVSEDGGFLIAGEMYQVNSGHLVNLQEQDRIKEEKAFAPKRVEMLQAVAEKDLVVYKPTVEQKGYVYIFTDIDCPFCRKLHSQMGAMLDMGIEVRYLAFPRAGINSRSAQKLSTVWCADNRVEMMDRFKSGQDVELAECEVSPVADHYILGKKVGIRGTPAIILESGQIIPGAVTPEMLAKEMGI